MAHYVSGQRGLRHPRALLSGQPGLRHPRVLLSQLPAVQSFAPYEEGFEFEEFGEGTRAPAKPKKPRKPRKPRKKGRIAKCKNVTVRGKRRRLCWDKHGTLVRNESPNKSRKRRRKKR